MSSPSNARTAAASCAPTSRSPRRGGCFSSSRQIAERVAQAPGFYGSLNAISGGRLAPAPGGLLLYHGGDLVGAVGISGDTGDNDETCVLAGVEAAGLKIGRE